MPDPLILGSLLFVVIMLQFALLFGILLSIFCFVWGIVVSERAKQKHPAPYYIKKALLFYAIAQVIVGFFTIPSSCSVLSSSPCISYVVILPVTNALFGIPMGAISLSSGRYLRSRFHK